MATKQWDPDVHAHNQTWMYLFMKGEILTSFPDSESLRMDQMAWWNAAANANVRKLDAQKVAIEIHRFFKDAMKRPYESDYEDAGFSGAIPDLARVLAVASNVLPALAEMVNQIFKFQDEE